MAETNFLLQNLDQDWQREYLRLGRLYASRAAWMVVLTFPSIILANLSLLEAQSRFVYILAYTLPSPLIALGWVFWHFARLRHEVLVSWMVALIFFASAIRTDENTLIIYLIINLVCFIASAVQMLILPVFNLLFLAYILLTHSLVAVLGYQESLAVYFTQSGGLVMLVLGLVFTGVNQLRYRILRNNFINSLALKQSYELLTQKSQEAARIAEKIKEQNQKITSSINYALRIQQAVLPPLETVRDLLPQSFIFYRPRDIVSGDFYWIADLRPFTEQDELLIAAVDCTGHGVPGAFMSLIGNTFLNQIVNEYRIFEPELILSNLHRSIQKALRQKETQNWDGMDIALLRLNRQERLAHFAGAKNPLVYVQNGQLHIVKGDKFSIGGNFIKDARFKSHTISLQGEEVFYLFSDGFQDQFGGEIGRKFTVGRFHELLFKLHPFALQDQQFHLIQALEAWQKSEEQVDDLLVIGFKA